MILPILVFLVSFVYLLSFLPTTLPDGLAGDWATAAWTLQPVGTANVPLPILLGKAALALFPFGSPAFRMNLMGALLTALTPVVALRIFSLAKPRPAPGPALLELDGERRWSTMALLSIFAWGISPPFVRTGTGGLPFAAQLFFPLLAFERFLSWNRTSPSSQSEEISDTTAGLAGGLAMTLDLKWGLFLSAFVILLRRPEQRKNRLPLVRTGGVLFASFLAPWTVLLAFQVATVEQLLHRLPSVLAEGFLPTWRISEVDLRILLLGGGLLMAYAAARGLHFLSTRFPRGVPAAVILVFLFEGGWLFFRPPGPFRAESEINDLFRSLPAGSTLEWSRPGTRASATYALEVLGKRRDLRLALKQGVPLPSDETIFREPLGPAEDTDLPVGFVLRPMRFPLTALSYPLAQVSLGRVPLFLAETPASAFMGDAHRRLGDAFALLRIPDQAEEEYLTALAENPEDASAWEALGRLLMDYGDWKRAGAALVEAARLGEKRGISKIFHRTNEHRRKRS